MPSEGMEDGKVPWGTREPARKRERLWSRHKTRRAARHGGNLRRSKNPPDSSAGSVNLVTVSAQEDIVANGILKIGTLDSSRSVPRDVWGKDVFFMDEGGGHCKFAISEPDGTPTVDRNGNAMILDEGDYRNIRDLIVFLPGMRKRVESCIPDQVITDDVEDQISDAIASNKNRKFSGVTDKSASLGTFSRVVTAMAVICLIACLAKIAIVDFDLISVINSMRSGA
jgi:hypothetical protein